MSKIEFGRVTDQIDEQRLAMFALERRMAKSETTGLSYGALRKECLEAVRQWPGCETIGAIQIVRDNTPGGFSVRVTLYGRATKKIADRAINCVQREKRRQFHLTD